MRMLHSGDFKWTEQLPSCLSKLLVLPSKFSLFFFVGGNIIIPSQCSQDSMLCLLSGGFVLVVFLMSCFGSSVDARKTVPQVINWYLGYMELIRQSKWNYLYLSHIFMCLKHCGAPIDIWQCREHGGNVQLKFRGHDKWKLLYVESLLNEHSTVA